LFTFILKTLSAVPTHMVNIFFYSVWEYHIMQNEY